MAKKTKKYLSPTPSAMTCQLDRKSARRDAKHLGLNKADLPNSIKEVIATLTDAGFEAYIVGGGVRDSLLGLQPKDFDAVTNATPNQVKDVFGKRCRIIGKRFQLCHVYSGRDMIEVATFRAPPKDSNHTTSDGMIVRDNVWGDIFQDVVRRDFSINALYYQPHEGFVYDFCGGLDDVANRTIRLLGDTQKRIEEDPVRLLRALRFKAKLGFEFEPALEQQFNPQNWSLLAQVSPHRLYDETQKMFTGGYLIPLLPLLFDYQAFEHLLFYPPKLTPLIEQVTLNTDKRINQGKSINPAFFYASLLWENYLYLLEKFKKNTPFVEAQSQSANKVMDKQRQHTAMPKFAEQFIKDIWLMQSRLAEPRKKNIQKLFENPRFRAGFDFLMLREQVEARNKALQAELGKPVTLDNESTNGMGHWWAWFQTLNHKQQQQAIDDFDINAVRLRFANFVKADFTQTGEASHALDDSNFEHSNHHANADAQADFAGNTPPKNRRERRRQREEQGYDKPNHGKEKFSLTEQQQQEKDQLQLLSLANDTPANTKPAQPLWGTPFNHQVAETAVIGMGEQTDVSEKSNVSQNSTFTENKASNSKAKQNRKTSRSNDKPTAQTGIMTAIERQMNVPAKRQRRQPSSNLSVAERRQVQQTLTENLSEKSVKPPIEKLTEQPKDTTAKPTARKRSKANVVVETPVKDSPAVELMTLNDTPIPKKRSRKKIVTDDTTTTSDTVNATANTTAVKTKTTTETVTEAETPKPKRSPRPRKKAVSDEPVKNGEVETATQTATPSTKPPAKRTRKKVVSDLDDVKISEVNETVSQTVTQTATQDSKPPVKRTRKKVVKTDNE